MGIWHFVSLTLTFLLIEPVLAQPNKRIEILQNTTIVWYATLEAFHQGPRFRDLMDAPLRTQTFGIVDTLRGWAMNVEEEHALISIALRLLRWATLRVCVMFVNTETAFLARNESVPQGLRFTSSDIIALENLVERKILEILHSNFKDFLRFAILRFIDFPIGVTYSAEWPHFNLALRHAGPIRHSLKSRLIYMANWRQNYTLWQMLLSFSTILNFSPKNALRSIVNRLTITSRIIAHSPLQSNRDVWTRALHIAQQSVQLSNIANQLHMSIDRITGNSVWLTFVFGTLRHQSFHPVYSPNSPFGPIYMSYGCASNLLVQDHFDYEAPEEEESLTVAYNG